jgi:hypothetical protein
MRLFRRRDRVELIEGGQAQLSGEGLCALSRRE